MPSVRRPAILKHAMHPYLAQSTLTFTITVVTVLVWAVLNALRATLPPRALTDF